MRRSGFVLAFLAICDLGIDLFRHPRGGRVDPPLA
jgi:hypothetical protein